MVSHRVAHPFSNDEIGPQLDISIKTAETHNLRTRDTRRPRSPADVIQFALRNGWLAPE